MRIHVQRIITAMLAVILFAAVAAAAPMKVTVDKVTGKVEMNASDTAGWKALKTGDAVPVGSAVRTGPGASCMLKWAGGNVVSVSPLTVLTVEEAEKAASGAEKSTLNLKNGKINAHAKKLSTKDSAFSVKTPTAVAGVRGTDVYGSMDGGAASFAVADGSLALEIGGEEIIIDDGFIVNIDDAGMVSPPEPIPPAMMKDLQQVRQEGGQEEAKAGEQKKAAAGEKKTESKDAGGDAESEESEESDEATDEGDDTEEADAGDTEAAPEAEVEAEVEVDTSDVSDSVTDNIDQILDDKITDEIVNEIERSFITGTVDVTIYVEPQ